MNFFKHEYKKNKHTITYNCLCSSCNGAGIYQGMAERGKIAVVCRRCKGCGVVENKISWHDPQPLKKVNNVNRIVQCNPGIVLGENKKEGIFYKDFGGMNYEDWLDGKPFTKGSEMRKFVCPAWWCQSCSGINKPNWRECCLCGVFSGCEYFKTKEKCWERFDKEAIND